MNIKEKIIPKNGICSKGSYSPGLKVCEQIYISGQLPIDPNTNQIVEGGIKQQTKQCLENMKHVLEEAQMDMKYVVKTTVYLKDISDFQQMNEVYETYFEDPYPARSACSVNGLVGDALVEIEAYAIDFRALEVLCCEEGECNGESCCCK